MYPLLIKQMLTPSLRFCQLGTFSTSVTMWCPPTECYIGLKNNKFLRAYTLPSLSLYSLS